MTPNRIKNEIGVDLIADDPESAYEAPEKILNKIFRLVNLKYRKHGSEVKEVVDNIDFQHLFSCNTKINSFFIFVETMDRCGLMA